MKGEKVLSIWCLLLDLAKQTQTKEGNFSTKIALSFMGFQILQMGPRENKYIAIHADYFSAVGAMAWLLTAVTGN